MNSRRFLWALAPLLAACGSGPSPRLPAPAAKASATIVHPLAPGDVQAAFASGLLQQETAQLISLGAEPLSVLALEGGADGAHAGAFVDVEPGSCLLVVARGTKGIDDLDVIVFADDGTVVFADEMPDTTPAVLICEPVGQRLYAMARVTSGKGVFALAAQRVHAALVAKVARTFDIKHALAAGVLAHPPTPSMLDRAHAYQRSLQGSWSQALRTMLGSSARSPGRMLVTVDARSCTAIVALSPHDGVILDVEIEDAQGRHIGRALPWDRNDAHAVICSPIATELQIAVRPRYGAVEVGVVAFRPVAPGALSDTMPTFRLDAFATDSIATAKRKLAERLGKANSFEREIFARVGAKTNVQLLLRPGCARIDAVAGAPTAGVIAEVWEPGGTFGTHAEAPTHATLFSCAETQREVRLELEAELRPGPIAVEVREQPIRGAPPSLAHARLLTRLAERSLDLDGIDVTAWTQTRELEHVHPIAFASAGCVDIALGLVSPHTGVRLIATTDSEELARTRGVGSAAMTLCRETQSAIELHVRIDGPPTLVAVATKPHQNK